MRATAGDLRTEKTFAVFQTMAVKTFLFAEWAIVIAVFEYIAQRFNSTLASVVALILVAAFAVYAITLALPPLFRRRTTLRAAFLSFFVVLLPALLAGGALKVLTNTIVASNYEITTELGGQCEPAEEARTAE